MGGVLGIPDPGGPSSSGIPWCHQDLSRQVAAVQVLLVCDLGMLQGLGVTSSTQNCSPLTNLLCEALGVQPDPGCLALASQHLAPPCVFMQGLAEVGSSPSWSRTLHLPQRGHSPGWPQRVPPFSCLPVLFSKSWL